VSKEYSSNIYLNPDDSYQATHVQKMAAFSTLLQDEQFRKSFVLKKEKAADPAKSMPSIFQTLKSHLTGLSAQDRSDAIRKLPNIYEDAETKKLGLETLEELNLPRYKRVLTTVRDFLRNPDSYCQVLRSKLYFPSVMNADTGVRHFELGLNQRETIKFLRELLKKHVISQDYLLALAEYQKNAYSGNITINPFLINGTSATCNSGDINVEFIDGVHADLAYGDKSPVVIAKNTLFADPRRINFEVSLNYLAFKPSLLAKLNLEITGHYVNLIDLKAAVAKLEKKVLEPRDLKKLAFCDKFVQLIMKALAAIPKDTDNGSHFSLNGQAPHPGYYEFIVNPENEIFFLDYRDPLHYSNLQYIGLQ